MIQDILNNPELVILLGIVIRILRAWQTQVTLPEYYALHQLKKKTFPFLDSYWPHFVHQKNGQDDAEYLGSVDLSLTETLKTLRSGGGSLHLLNSLKQLPDGSTSDGHVVWTHSDGTQTEAYVFSHGNGVDVYAHHETSVSDVQGHLEDAQTNGDPRGVVTGALESNVVAFSPNV